MKTRLKRGSKTARPGRSTPRGTLTSARSIIFAGERLYGGKWLHAGGFDAATYPGLQNRRYPSAFLKAVRSEGSGRTNTAVDGKRYIAHDGSWRYEEVPPVNRDNPLVEKVSGAVRRGAFPSGTRLRLQSAEVEEAFGNLDWVGCHRAAGSRPIRWIFPGAKRICTGAAAISLGRRGPISSERTA